MSCSPRLRISRTAITPVAPAPTSSTADRPLPLFRAARWRLRPRSQAARRATRTATRPPKAVSVFSRMIEMGTPAGTKRVSVS